MRDTLFQIFREESIRIKKRLNLSLFQLMRGWEEFSPDRIFQALVATKAGSTINFIRTYDWNKLKIERCKRVDRVACTYPSRHAHRWATRKRSTRAYIHVSYITCSCSHKYIHGVRTSTEAIHYLGSDIEHQPTFHRLTYEYSCEDGSSSLVGSRCSLLLGLLGFPDCDWSRFNRWFW